MSFDVPSAWIITPKILSRVLTDVTIPFAENVFEITPNPR